MHICITSGNLRFDQPEEDSIFYINIQITIGEFLKADSYIFLVSVTSFMAVCVFIPEFSSYHSGERFEN